MGSISKVKVFILMLTSFRNRCRQRLCPNPKSKWIRRRIWVRHSHIKCWPKLTLARSNCRRRSFAKLGHSMKRNTPYSTKTTLDKSTTSRSQPPNWMSSESHWPVIPSLLVAVRLSRPSWFKCQTNIAQQTTTTVSNLGGWTRSRASPGTCWRTTTRPWSTRSWTMGMRLRKWSMTKAITTYGHHLGSRMRKWNFIRSGIMERKSQSTTLCTIRLRAVLNSWITRYRM